MKPKTLDLVLNAVAAVVGALCAAYFAFRYGSGLFTVLPPGVADVFTRHDGLQYVLLVILVVVLIVKIPVGRARKRSERDNGV